MTRQDIVKTIKVSLVSVRHGNAKYQAEWDGPNPGVGHTCRDIEKCRVDATRYIMTNLELPAR